MISVLIVCMAFKQDFGYIRSKLNQRRRRRPIPTSQSTIGGCMKRFSAVLVLVVLCAGLSFSQVGFGIKGGVNFANTGGVDALAGSKALTGFAAGGYLEFNVPFLFTIQPEVLYSQKGFTAEQNVLGYDVKATGHFNYLEIPVLLKFSLPVPIVKPSLYAGPAMGILLSAKEKAEVTGLATQESDVKDSTASTDWGFVIGASANIAVITVDIRYTMGVATLDKSGQTKVFNRVFSIMVGIPL